MRFILSGSLDSDGHAVRVPFAILSGDFRRLKRLFLFEEYHVSHTLRQSTQKRINESLGIQLPDSATNEKISETGTFSKYYQIMEQYLLVVGFLKGYTSTSFDSTLLVVHISVWAIIYISRTKCAGVPQNLRTSHISQNLKSAIC